MPLKLLAFDTATESMSVALQAGGRVWLHDGAGGAQASATLIPVITQLLAEAGVALGELDALAFGRGPGAFTGLRTACAVAQGLAFGASLPVLPLDSLLAVAEDARQAGAATPLWVVVDARMGEVYAAQYHFDGGAWRTLTEPLLATPQALQARWRHEAPQVLAGNALAAFGEALAAPAASLFPQARPAARTLLPLAAQAWAGGAAVDAALALPRYVRDKVAQTTAERAAVRAAGAEAIAAAGSAAAAAAGAHP